MVSVAKALEKVKDDYGQLIPSESILEICDFVKHQFRKRLLGPVETFYLFFVQVLHGNTACSAIRHLTDVDCSASAYCRARGRLPVALLRTLLRWVCDSLRTVTEPTALWLGHRVFHLDGSSFSMPDTEALQAEFGQPGGQKKGCGFPVAHLLVMFDASTGLLLDILAFALRTHDMSKVACLHPRLRSGDVLVGDRGFCSFAHLALLLQRGLHGVFRIHQRIIVSFRPRRRHAKRKGKGRNAASQKGLPRSQWLRRIGVKDQIVRWFKPARKPAWMSAGEYQSLPESILVRELEYRIESPGYRTRKVRLVTTLLEEGKYEKAALAELYRCRWRIEVNLRHLKTTMGMEVLRCETPHGVRKEMLMFGIVYNLVCCVILDAAAQQGVRPDRVSFVDALRWLMTWKPDKELIVLIVNPSRPGRFAPRAVKRRPKPYPLLTEPRETLRNRLLRQELTA